MTDQPIIKPFAFWNPETWEIPSLYWDAFSQEQRIHAICKQLGKVIGYADYLGMNTEDIAKRLKAIEEGQLDEFIIAEIEEWFAENQPAIITAISNLEDALPIAEFDSVNTVKAALDYITSLLPAANFNENDTVAEALSQLAERMPFNEFDDEHTIKDALDAINVSIGDVDELLPANEFDSVNTVKAALDGIESDVSELEAKTKAIMVSNAISADVSPIYYGDVLSTTYHGQGITVHDDYAYMLQANSSYTSQQIVCADLRNNSISYTRTLNIFGHANSMTYDTVRNCFWVTGENYLYQSTNDFQTNNAYTTGLGESITRIAFDHATGILWAVTGLSTDSIQKLHYMKSDETVFTYFGEYENPNKIEQDIAVYDDVLVVANSYFGARIAYLDRENEQIEFIDFINFGSKDSSGTWAFNEPEGIDFDENGMLWVSYVNVLSGGYNNFLCNIPFMGRCKQPKLRNPFQTFQLTLTNSNQTDFASAINHVKSLAQLEFRDCENVRQVIIQDDANISDPYTARLAKDICVVINSYYSCKSITLKGGFFGLQIAADGTLNFTEEPGISAVNFAGAIVINSNGYITHPSGKTINIGELPAIVYVNQIRSGTSIKVDDTTVSNSKRIVIDNNVISY